MPPEQASGKRGLTTACDVYSLGAILYELLTGRPPFHGETPLDTIFQVLEKEAESPQAINPQLDSDLAAVCLKCLAKEPSERYPSAAALADDLENWLAGEPLAVRPRSTPVVVWRWLRKNVRSAATVIGLGLACGALIGLQFFLHQIYGRGAMQSYKHFPSLQAPWPLSIAPGLPEGTLTAYFVRQGILGVLPVVSLLMVGLVLAVVVRPRDVWADLSASGLTALTAAAVFFFVGLGPSIVVDFETNAIRADVHLLAKAHDTGDQSAKPAGAFANGAANQHDVLEEEYPDLREAPADRRADYLASKILADLWPAAIKGIWSGILCSLLLFLPTCVVQTTVAAHLLRRGKGHWRILGPYLEAAVLAFAWSCALLAVIITASVASRGMIMDVASLLALLTTWLALCLLAVFRKWGWWQRWILHASNATLLVFLVRAW
jgi:hypothetical protein